MEFIEKYALEYLQDFVLTYSKHVSTRIYDVEIEIDVFEYNNYHHHREKAHVTMKKGGLTYECDFYDRHSYKHCFYPVTLNGHRYIFFSKTLYGFTLINADTLATEYDYFPECVTEGEESFIIANVKQLDDLFIFDGCYWADSYKCFAFDYKTKLFLDVSEMRGLDSVDRIEIHNDQLILYSTDDEDTEIQIAVSDQEIMQGFQSRGTRDF